VIELGVQPGIEGVAGAAGRGEFCENVIGIDSFLKIGQVAGCALRRQTQVVSDGGVLVAFLAFHNRVRTEERKAVEMLLNGLHGNLPTKHCMALRAVLAKLRAVNVSMALRAVLPNVGENRLGVASRAGNFFVHAAKRIASAVVVEFRKGADRRPACVGMAIFAGDGQRSMRTSARLSLGDRGQGNGERANYQRQPMDEPHHSRNGCPQTL
jgi:hypothetical protein